MKGLIKKLLALFNLGLISIPSKSNLKDINIFIDDMFKDIYKQNNFIFCDVGARGGINPEWNIFKGFLKVIAFEPDYNSYIDLIKSETEGFIKYFNIALSNKKELRELYVTRGGDQSSIFYPNLLFLNNFHELPVERWDIIADPIIETDRLDDILDDNGFNELDYLKIDTQGSEKLILEGASNICRSSVICMEVESFFTDVYLNQPLFSDVDLLVRSLGFYLFDIRKYYWRRDFIPDIKGFKGQLIFCEALYFKKIEEIQQSKAKLLKAITMCIYYGLFDYALEILDRSLKAIITNNEYRVIKKALIDYSTAFKGKINYDDKTLCNSPWITY